MKRYATQDKYKILTDGESTFYIRIRPRSKRGRLLDRNVNRRFKKAYRRKLKKELHTMVEEQT